MKKYLLTIITFILGVACFVSYNIIGSEIAPDGTLIEPFGLMPIGFLANFIIYYRFIYYEYLGFISQSNKNR
ncbi:DUF3955 domain-containing protein [Paraclostridium bifermentans]|nr:DUF3955 domain-containing protein [Paraclostridium bifermentans]